MMIPSDSLKKMQEILDWHHRLPIIWPPEEPLWDISYEEALKRKLESDKE